MNIVDEVVIHKKYGYGRILRQEKNIIDVIFDAGNIKFQFPEGFEKFLTFEKEELQNFVLKLLEDKRIETARIIQEKREEQERIKAAKEREMKPAPNGRKKVEKANIAFKCNFCDGGCSIDNIGYKGVCSDEIIKHNIEVRGHKACNNAESYCFKYYNGIITREDLEDFMKVNGSVCYESKMLINWEAHAGYSLTKENYLKPMTLPRVQTHSLCVLTTRLPYMDEKDRFIFAVFLVDDTFVGNDKNDGYVTTSSKFRLSFSMEEAQKLKYWNYCVNSNKPEKISWNQGLYRYIDDVQVSQILRDIVKLKKGTKDEELSVELYDYFLQINDFKDDDIPMNNGALLRN